MANSVTQKKKKNAAGKKKTTTTSAVPDEIVPPTASPITATTSASPAPVPTQYPLSPSSAPVDVIYTATADKADETVQYYQEEEVQKYLSVHPGEMTSLASTMSLGELSHTSAGQPSDVPTIVHAQPVSSLLSVVISTLFVVIISVVGDGNSTNNITHNNTDCTDCNVVSVETWSVLERPKRSVTTISIEHLSINPYPNSTYYNILFHPHLINTDIANDQYGIECMRKCRCRGDLDGQGRKCIKNAITTNYS